MAIKFSLTHTHVGTQCNNNRKSKRRGVLYGVTNLTSHLELPYQFIYTSRKNESAYTQEVDAKTQQHAKTVCERDRNATAIGLK